jgi:hypothetical protein
MAKFRAGIFKQRTYNQIGVYLNKLKNQLKPKQQADTNAKILAEAMKLIRQNFTNEKQGDGTPMKEVNTEATYSGIETRFGPQKTSISYFDWKNNAIRKGYRVNGRTVKGPNKTMTLTRLTRTLPSRPGGDNAGWITDFNATGIYIESRASNDGFEYAKFQTLNGRNFMPTVKAISKIAKQIYEKKLNKVKSR